MVNYNSPGNSKTHQKKPHKAKRESRTYRRLACMGKRSFSIINEISIPVDAANRFINLTLEDIEENSQTREFLLESKEAIRKTMLLLKKLSDYAKKIEREADGISIRSKKNTRLGNK